MNDIIYKSDAIDAVEFGITYAKAIDVNTGESKELFKEGNDALKKAVERLKELPSAESEITRCKDCRWGREVCGNIECFVDNNIPPEYHGYEWFCPNGER